MKELKIISVVGARPNFIKIAPIMRELKKYDNITSILVHTGQHYDKNMSDSFFVDLDIQDPDYNLEVGSASHAKQTADIMIKFEDICIKENPDAVLVVGDVNSTIACSLVAKKLGIKVIHVESGLRSFDERMPEEINRILTDRISNLLFVSEESGITNLKNEGVSEEKTFLVGNVMIDSLVYAYEKIKNSKTCNIYNLKQKEYSVLTLHRPSNVDNKEKLTEILETISILQKKEKIIIPLHPRTRNNLEKFKLMEKILEMGNLKVVEPQDYISFLSLVMDSRLILTDSGGIQEETTFLKIPCITLRENTERPSTTNVGSNVIVGTDRDKIVSEFDKIINNENKESKVPKLWDGHTSERIVKIIAEKLK